MKIGVIVDSFRCDFKTSVEKAAAIMRWLDID